MTADQGTEKKHEIGVTQPCQSSRQKGVKLELELPPMLPTFNNTALSAPSHPENMDLYIPTLSTLDMANNQPAGVPLIPFMPMTPMPGNGKVENGNMGMALPYSMMLPPLIEPQGDPLLQAGWNFMPKIKVTNNKSKRGRKKAKTEVLMFNPNMFPTFGVPMKDEFGLLGMPDKRMARKNCAPKPLTNKEQRLRETGSYVQVYRGTKKYTKGGLTKKDLVKNKKGRIVSKRQQSHNPLKKWVTACKQAKKELKIPGFCPLNKGPKGKALYKRAKEIYEEMKARDKKIKMEQEQPLAKAKTINWAATDAKATEKLSPKVQSKKKQKITDLGSYSF